MLFKYHDTVTLLPKTDSITFSSQMSPRHIYFPLCSSVTEYNNNAEKNCILIISTFDATEVGIIHVTGCTEKQFNNMSPPRIICGHCGCSLCFAN